MAKDQAWRVVSTACRDVVLVCRKCSRKLDGGFGPDGDDRLGKALRRSLGGATRGKEKPRRRATLVAEVGCLDICPKGAVVAIVSGEPRRWIVIPKGAAMADVVARLGLSGRA